MRVVCRGGVDYLKCTPLCEGCVVEALVCVSFLFPAFFSGVTEEYVCAIDIVKGGSEGGSGRSHSDASMAIHAIE